MRGTGLATARERGWVRPNFAVEISNGLLSVRLPMRRRNALNDESKIGKIELHISLREQPIAKDNKLSAI